MTKENVVSAIADQTGITKTMVSDVVENFISVIKNSMAEGNNIYIRGFGSFQNKKKARKIARNIRKNTQVIIEEHYAPKFKPANIFINKIKMSIPAIKE